MQSVSHHSLFDSVALGAVRCPNRFAMAPLTRNRTKQPGNIPTELNATYYAQRAQMGLIVSEATQVSQEGQGYLWTPGIYTQAQIDGWKLVTHAVQAAGGRIALQLWHVGRVSHSSLQPGGGKPLSPSGVGDPTLKTFAIGPSGAPGPVDCTPPREMSHADIERTLDDYTIAARNAKLAGFQCVEIHAANGYLIEQFLVPGTNRRTDGWGGSVEKRGRFLVEAFARVAQVFGKDRVGVRLSPNGAFNAMPEFAEWREQFDHAAHALRGAMYLHLYDQASPESRGCGREYAGELRKRFGGPLILCGGFTPEEAQRCIDAGQCDMVAFGKAAISNPDLVARVRAGLPLAPWNQATFYGGGAEGYTDYPTAT